MEFTRRSVVKHLESRGIFPSPTQADYRARVESFILLHFDLMSEELANPKQFRDYCSKFTSKVKEYYMANGRLIDRMLEDKSHKVISYFLQRDKFENEPLHVEIPWK